MWETYRHDPKRVSMRWNWIMIHVFSQLHKQDAYKIMQYATRGPKKTWKGGVLYEKGLEKQGKRQTMSRTEMPSVDQQDATFVCSTKPELAVNQERRTRVCMDVNIRTSQSCKVG